MRLMNLNVQDPFVLSNITQENQQSAKLTMETFYIYNNLWIA